MKIIQRPGGKSILTYLLAILLTSFSAGAQEVGITWGTEATIEKKSSAPEFLGVRDGKIFVIKSDNPKDVSSYYITINDEASLEEETKIDLERVLPKDVGHNDMFRTYLLKDRIVIVTTSKNKELVASTIDLKGKIVKGKIIVDKVEGKDKAFDGYRASISPDQSKILGYRSQKGKVKNTVAYNFVVFDQELKRVKELKIELPYEDDNFEFGKVSLDDKGDVFAVAMVKIEGKRKKYDTHKAVLISLPLSQAKPELNEVVLPFEKRIASSMSYIMQPNKIIITGMYASNKDADNLEGIFYTELDPKNFSVLSSSYEKFKPGLQTRKLTSKKMDSKVGFQYSLKDIFLNGEEQFLIFESEVVTFTTTKTGTTKTTYTGDLIIAKLSADHKILWNTMVSKNQFMNIPYTQTVGGASIGILSLAMSIPVYKYYKKFEDLLSYTVMYKNNDIYFVFNDHIKNIKSKNTDKPFNSFKKSYAALVKLDGDKGKWEKKAIFNTKESERIITPNNSIQISNNKVLTYSYWKKKGSIGYLTID